MTAGNGVRSALWLIVIALAAGSLPQFILPVDSAEEVEWGYHTSAQIATMIEDLARSNPDRAEATTAQEMFGTHSIEGMRKIPILFIGDSINNDNPNVMLIGAHHGNEPDSAEAVLGFASYLLETNDDLNTQVLDNVNIIVLPVINPYGLDNGIRVDENGEDPNRDYPFAPSPFSTDSDGIPLTTQGARVVHELAKRYPISIALSFHTGSWGIFSTWGAQGLGNITPDHRALTDIGKAMSKASAQRMPYGPANDYSGISYLTGAYDDHLYGSSLLPGKIYSSEMVLPYSTAAYTIELGTQTGKDPSGLGSPSDMESSNPSAKAIPTAIRICLAACMMASPSVSEKLSGSTAEFTVFGADSAGEIVIDSVQADGITPTHPIERSDPIYPITTFVSSGGPGDSALILHGPIHPEWMDLHPGAYPVVAPRSLVAQSSIGGVFRVQSIGSPSSNAVRIVRHPPDVTAGSSFNVTVGIDTAATISDLTVTIGSGGSKKSYVFIQEDLKGGENELTVKAPSNEGYGTITATLRTSGGRYKDISLFDVHPALAWTAGMSGSDLKLNITMIGANSVKPVMVRLSPIGSSSIAPDPWSFYIGPGKNEKTINLSHIYGEYAVTVFLSPNDVGKSEIVDVPPTMVLSRVPILISGDELTIGPVTAYLGGVPMGPSGPFGENNVTVIADSGSDSVVYTLDFIPLDMLTDAERNIALDQARMAGCDPVHLEGAFIERTGLPGSGSYTVSGYLENDIGQVRAPEGIPTEMITYDSFSVDDDESDFPYELVGLFLILIVVMIIVSYLRFPVKMESLAKRELARKELENKELARRRQRK